MGEYFLRSERSYVDVSTNYASISSIDLDFEAEDFFEGDICVHHLLTLIHEITHHWSLTSHVGTALSAHHLRSHVLGAKVLAGLQLTSKEQQDMERSVIIGKLCHAFLAPLFEGLALYAEWRVNPFDDVIYSRPFAIVRWLAGGAQNFTTEEKSHLSEVIEEMQNAGSREYQRIMKKLAEEGPKKSISRNPFLNFAIGLQKLRANPIFLDRKASLFEKRIDPAVDPYQVGYAFVCGLELSCSASRNTDRFLAFIKDYFLNDIHLARMISKDIEGPYLYTLIRERLQSRVNKFFTDPGGILEIIEKWDEDQGFIREIGGELGEKFSASEHIHHSCELSPEEYSAQRIEFRNELDEILAVDPSFVGLSPRNLNEFLYVGRLAMPFRVREATVSKVENSHIHCTTDRGAKFVVPAKESCDHFTVGEKVIILLMVGVSSGDTGLCIFSSNCSKVLLRSGDDEIHDFWSQALRHYPKIMALRDIGSSALERLRIVSDDADAICERLDSNVMTLLESDSFKKDLEQIYRMPITLSFTNCDEHLRDSAWREREFEKWKETGVSSIFEAPRDLIDFARCSMVTMRINIDLPDTAYEKISEGELSDAFVKALYGFSRSEYLDIVGRLDETASSKGVKLFSEEVDGFRYPYL